MFLILTPTAFEQQALRDVLGAAESRTFAHRNQVQGLLADRTVVLLETGIGAVNTAQALTAVLQASRPVLVLQIGVGGAYLSSGLGAGDLAIATEENYGDLGVLTPDGWQPADVIGIPVLQKDRDYFNRFPAVPRPGRPGKGTGLQHALGCPRAPGPFRALRHRPTVQRSGLGRQPARRPVQRHL